MAVVVSLTKAVICFAAHCYPILYGVTTPVGEYQMNERIVLTPGYGGNVIQFFETDKEVYSIHRLWLGRPSEHREKRIKSDNLKDRVVSKGCINVEPAVFDELKNCCIMDHLTITR